MIPQRLLHKEPTSCFLLQSQYSLWRKGAEGTEGLARLARTNLPLAEVQRVRQGLFYRNGKLTKSVPTQNAWVGRCVVLLDSWNTRLQRIPRMSGVRMQGERTLP